MDLGSILAVCVIFGSFIVGTAALTVCSISLICFGALAVLPPSITGGVSLQASSIAFGCLFVRVLYEKGLAKIAQAALSPRRLGLLTAFISWACLCTLVMPTLFEGLIYVYPLRSSGDVYSLAPVSPTTSNLTQIMYLLLSYLCAVAFSVLAESKEFSIALNRGIYTLSMLLLITGIIDLMNGNELLSLFRNANYALVGDTNVGTAKRIVGAMPEASVYGATSAALFSVLMLLRRRFRSKFIWGISSACMAAAAILSTSSTAYAMIATIAACLLVQILLFLFFGSFKEKKRSIYELIAICFSIALASEIILYADELRRTASFLIDQIVLKKSLSSSFEERTRWSMVAYDAFFQSNGLGIGVGTARTSNGIINILASTGVIGFTLFFAFAIRIFVVSSYDKGQLERFSVPLALLGPFVGLALASPTADFGPLIGILFGIQSSFVASNAAGTSEFGHNKEVDLLRFSGERFGG